MIKSFIRRHRLLLLPFAVIIGIAVLSWTPLAAQTFTTPQIAPVIITEATVAPQGVLVKWLAIQSPQLAVRYTIEREVSRDHFVQVAQVEKNVLSYLDSEGKSGDSYRIFAEDSQQPTTRSKASEIAVAAIPRPGSNIKVVSSELPNTPSVPSVTTLGDLMETVDAAVVQGQQSTIEASLLALYNYQTHILSRIFQLPIADKKAFGQLCRDNEGMLETDFHLLPERHQMDGNLIIAACDAIGEAAE